eukprot:CAMPEP_0183596434 /NCGR_PEP_ID=MMETSP0371-20130417/175103_1 /TAXON_ID=268820 /ORGANISM="Peridinium aciculiferum, Strain PAER-2" /LENGTH=62 /DNA_ID=CAMNT_0025808309 /DNA_START=42 /DNA_END=227 /DNA_ORIENTATION=-
MRRLAPSTSSSSSAVPRGPAAPSEARGPPSGPTAARAGSGLAAGVAAMEEAEAPFRALAARS